MKKTAKKTAGIALIGIGVVGLFVPILQGVILIIAGACLVEYEPLNKFGRSIYKKCKKTKKKYLSGSKSSRKQKR